MARNQKWIEFETEDVTPKKGIKTFTDYKCGQYVIRDYADCFHVWHEKVFLGRYKTLREAKATVYDDVNHTEYAKKLISITLFVPRKLAEKYRGKRKRRRRS